MRSADVWPDVAVVLPCAASEADDARDSAAPPGLTSTGGRSGDRGAMAQTSYRNLRHDRPGVSWPAQLFHFFALMLWGAAVLAVIAGMPQLSIAIVVIVIVNGLFAFAQEHRAERAAEHLRDLLPRIGDGRAGRPARRRSTRRSWSSATWCCWRQATGSRPTCGRSRHTRSPSTPRP